MFLFFFLLGISIPKQQYNIHPNQPLSGDTTIPGTIGYNDDRAVNMPTNFGSAPSPTPSPPQFVQNPAGIGPRSVPKRSTFIRTRHVDASAEDLNPDQQRQEVTQQQPNEYNAPSPNVYGPQIVRPTSNAGIKPVSQVSGNNFTIRPPLIHGAPDSKNSSGHDSGLSSGGASFDPEQHHMYNLGNPSNSIRSTTPTVDVYEVPPPVPLPKRKSLPSIIKDAQADYKVDETARSSDNLKEKETFIIENGIRKRVKTQKPKYTESGSMVPEGTVMTSSSGSPMLAHPVILESITKLDETKSTKTSTGGNKRGSMPTVVNIARHRQEAPSKLI